MTFEKIGILMEERFHGTTVERHYHTTLSSKSTKKSGLKHSLVFQSFITIRKKVHVASTQYKWCSIGGLWGLEPSAHSIVCLYTSY